MCVGYAQAFCKIAEKAGIKTYVVSSEKLQHAWNMVNINGEYYFVDCTWDDPVLIKSIFPMIRFRGMAVTNTLCVRKSFL